MSSYYNKYLKYKNKYLNLKKQTGGEVNKDEIYDYIISKTFLDCNLPDEYNEIQANVNADIEFLKVRSYEGENGTYKKDRYSSFNEVKTDNDDNYIVLSNTFDSGDYLRDKNLIKINPAISELKRPEYICSSTGDLQWIGFNWSIIRNIDDNMFKFVVGMEKESSVTEFGIKHTILSIPHDLYVAGEGRIINSRIPGKYLLQFNLNSSSFDTNKFEPIFGARYREIQLTLKKYYAYKVKQILEKILTNSSDCKYKVESTELSRQADMYGRPLPTNDFDERGLRELSIDPVSGLLYYYSQQVHRINDEFSKDAMRYKKENNKDYIFFKFKKDRYGYKYIVGDDFVIKVETNTGGKTYEYIANPLDLQFMDERFLKFLSMSPHNNLGSTTWPYIDYEIPGASRLILENLRSSGLEKVINNFNFMKCNTSRRPIIKSNRDIDYQNFKCFRSQGAGSANFIITNGEQIIMKGDTFDSETTLSIAEDSHFIKKFNFFKEAWVNDYLMRTVYNTNISHNLCRMTDIFICDRTITIDPRDPLTGQAKDQCMQRHSLTDGRIVAYIAMEILDGVISGIVGMNYGMFFEYLYGKLACKVVSNIIFTDQANTGNCGYKNVDFVRKYIITQGTNSIEVWVEDTKMIKMVDFGDFKYSPNTEKVIYHDTGDVFNQSLNIIQTEQVACSQLNKSLIDNFRGGRGNQVDNFIQIIQQSIPQKYRTAPTGGRQIQEFRLNIQ